jgi:probable rRNA maturation factor
VQRAITQRRLIVSVTDARGRPIAAHGLASWLPSAAPARARGFVTIALVGDAVMRRLNRQYRGADYATDVLSFPAEHDRACHMCVLGDCFLGDIVIATGVCRRQARTAGHAESAERRMLALHGLLHLLGYDHETDAGTMGRVEERLRRRAGLPTGLIARASPGC